MKLFNQTRKYGAKIVTAADKAAVGAMIAIAAASASAQSTDPFDTAVAAMTTKVTSYGGALVTFCAVAVAFWVAMKYIKKIPKAA